MASVRKRVQGDGSVKYAVLFRERATRKKTSLTFASRDEAERMAASSRPTAETSAARSG